MTQRTYGYDNFESRLPQIQTNFGSESASEKKIREERASAVKKAFMHGWTGYKTHALGHDELKPLTEEPHNPFGGMGATLVDSLGTMIIMELHDEFDQVIAEVEKINFYVDKELSVFETTIRYLGGLLSAYELTDHPKKHILLEKAKELGEALLPAFDTRLGIPYYKFNPVTQMGNDNSTLLADMASLQLEFFTLSHYTENPIFAKKAQAITDFLDSAGYAHGVRLPGLYPNEVDLDSGYFTDTIASFGAMGDSAYEYFLKEYILTDGSIPQYARMYLQSIDSMKQYMLMQLPGTKFLYLPAYDTARNLKEPTMDHLTCFVPGMLAIGSRIFNRPDDIKAAKGLLETCVYMYRSSATGLAPESWIFPDQIPYNPLTYGKSLEELEQLPPRRRYRWPGKKNTPVAVNVTVEVPNRTNRTLDPPIERPSGLYARDYRYLLRPETVESLFILYRITGDPRYQEYGWEIFKAIEERCRTPVAYAAVRNVSHLGKGYRLNQIDSMESFLFAETFKYLYLLFSPPEMISLDKFVFTTEAHPLLRRPWTDTFIEYKA
ncbi:seven-hairpin glycosidase [Rhizopus microsporus ATCC 52813]|uniref:alpha-1,2-Mannosidase n=1 Tax=Rhizopus microsporus ATCC 52813 TaxID=1340429 RepID=A0A2G4STB3_RHIZD|nr:seven-hairpin glycosidase [Rhizopus microsporus ATCC 52813]PHZ12000.1 seven-hairpin glycosidase [Rhizopus microsporus ATCC 52813]